MKRAFPTKRVQALAKAIRNMTKYRPNRGGVTGIGKAERWHQPQPSGRNSDCRSVLLQERVLLDRTVESVFRSDRVIRDIESRWVITQHAVGHGNLGGKRLQRIETLIRIVNCALQLAILNFQAFLFMAQSVIVADLPEHARIGTGRSNNGDRSNQGQYCQTVQSICWNNQLPEFARRGGNEECIVLPFY